MASLLLLIWGVLCDVILAPQSSLTMGVCGFRCGSSEALWTGSGAGVSDDGTWNGTSVTRFSLQADSSEDSEGVRFAAPVDTSFTSAMVSAPGWDCQADDGAVVPDTGTAEAEEIGLLQLQSIYVSGAPGNATEQEILLSTWLSPSSRVLMVAGHTLPTANNSAALSSSFIAAVDLPAYSRLSPNALAVFPHAHTYVAAMWAGSDMWMVSTDLTAVLSPEAGASPSSTSSTCSEDSLLAGEAHDTCIAH